MAVTNGFANLALDSSVDAVKTSVDAVKSALDTGITVALNSASLSALENTTVELGATSLAALESITATGPLTDAQLRATPVVISDGTGSITVDGSVSITGSTAVTGTFWQATQPVSLSSLPLPTGAATQTTLAAIDSKLGSTLSVNVGLTDDQLRASPVPVSISGSIPVTIASALEITNDAGNPIPVNGTVAVTGTFWQETQPVSIASVPLPTGASTSALQTTGNSSLSSIDSKLSGSLTVSTGLSQPLTDTQLRATAVPISGTVELGATSLAALENTTVSVSGTVPVSLSSAPLPTGAATETTLDAIKSLQTTMKSVQDEIKTLNDTMLVLLSAMLEKMPRVTGTDQVAASVEALPTLANVTTVATVTTLTNMNQVGGKHINGDALNMAGNQHIYNNIVVS